MDPRWLRIGEHRGLRKRVIESFRLKDTIRAIDSECYGPDGEPKDSVDQDTTRVLEIKCDMSFLEGQRYRYVFKN